MIPGSANRKIVSVNQNMGAKNILDQQGTTRVIYDSLKITNTTVKQTLRFFENVNTRQFPFTNLNENKLQIGESIALQRFSFALMVTEKNSSTVKSILPIDNLAAGTNAIYRSDLNVNIAQNQVVKKLPLHSMYAPFNKDAKFYGQILINPGTPALEANLGLPNDVFYFDNPIVIPPQIEFVLELEMCAFTSSLQPDTQDVYLVCTLEGLGSLFAPKYNF
jgi:hypothetical protein